MRNLRFVIAVAVLLLGAGINFYLSKPDISLPRKSFTEFPKSLGEWVAAVDHEIDDRSMKILRVDDYIIRTYRNSEGEMISLYVGYFMSQREGKGIHSPRQCLPGAGWAPVQTSVYEMPVEALPFPVSSGFNTGNSKFKIQHSQLNVSTIQMNRFVMGKGLNKELYHFWYQGRERVYASEYWNKIYLIWDGLIKRRTDGALVRVNSSVNGNLEKAVKAQTEFIKTIFPLLREYIPD